MLLRPLQKIEVLKSNKKYKPGSVGYLAAQAHIRQFNAWHMCVVFTRFGKGGKPRSDAESVRVRMVEYDAMSERDQRIISIVAGHEGIEPQSYTNREREGFVDAVIKPIPRETRNIIDGSVEETIAHIMALSMLIYKLSSKRNVRALLSSSYEQAFDPASNFDLNLVQPEHLGLYILRGRIYDGSSKKYQSNGANMPSFENALRDQIRSKDAVRSIMTKLQKSLAMTKSSYEQYLHSNKLAFEGMCNKISNVLTYYKRSKKVLKEVEDQMNYYSSRSHSIYLESDYTR